MDSVCDQYFDDKLHSLLIENEPCDTWKDLQKDNCSNTESLTALTLSIPNDSTVSNAGNILKDIVTECPYVSEQEHATKVTKRFICDKVLDSPNTHHTSHEMDNIPKKLATLDADKNCSDIPARCTGNIESQVDVEDMEVENGACLLELSSHGLENQEQNSDMRHPAGTAAIKVCGISNCFFYGKPDPLVSIEKVDHNFEDNSSCSRISDDKEFCADVVQISSGDEEENYDESEEDDESVNSLVSETDNLEVDRINFNPDATHHVCSMMVMEVSDLSIMAMRAGPIFCTPSHNSIVFQDLSNLQHPNREMAIFSNCLESHRWVPVFGGLILDMILNLTSCLEGVMTFFQVPSDKIAKYSPRFPASVLKLYFGARVVDLSLRPIFQQFLNSNLIAKHKISTWNCYSQESSFFNPEFHHSTLDDQLPDHLTKQHIKKKPEDPRKKLSCHLQICRSSRTPSKVSYYRPPRWPYLRKVESIYHKIKTNSLFLQENNLKISGFDPSLNVNWMINHSAPQNYFLHSHTYYSNHFEARSLLRNCDYPAPRILGLNSLNSHSQLYPSSDVALATSTHSLHANQWFGKSRNETSPVYINSGFAGTTTKLFTYRPPNSKGGINVTNEDLFCLNDGEYLNDVVIDFYLKYLVEEVLSEKDRMRTHVFSSFFYGHLISGETQDPMSSLTTEEQRHRKVKTWTRHVDIFSKDFIIVPINESYHWFLAIICFPNVNGYTKCRSFPSQCSNQSLQASKATELQLSSILSPIHHTKDDISDNSDSIYAIDMESQNKAAIDGFVPNFEHSIGEFDLKIHLEEQSECSLTANQTNSNLPLGTAVNVPILNETDKASGTILHELLHENAIKLCETINNNCLETCIRSEDTIAQEGQNEEVTLQVSEDTSSVNEIKLSETPSSSVTNSSSTSTSETFVTAYDVFQNLKSDEIDLSKECKTNSGEGDEGLFGSDGFNAKNPCILIFDSLKGESRYDIVNILRQYLQVEWNFKKHGCEGKRVFDKLTMKGSMVNCPQQPNSSDCGIYVLQFVESFFMNPVKDFTLPLSLSNWFTSKEAMSKRYHLAKLIMKLKNDLNPSLEYDPMADGCFNIAPILSNNEGDDVKEQEDKKNHVDCGKISYAVSDSLVPMDTFDLPNDAILPSDVSVSVEKKD